MSAFIVNPKHIAKIALIQNDRKNKTIYNLVTGKKIVDLDGNDLNAEQVAYILADANCESIYSKYGGDSVAEFAGKAWSDYCLECMDEAVKAEKESLKFSNPKINPPSLFNMIRCLDYQSCEITKNDYTSGWAHTDAFWILQAFRDHIAQDWKDEQEMGYEDDGITIVEWEYREDELLDAVFHG